MIPPTEQIWCSATALLTTQTDIYGDALASWAHKSHLNHTLGGKDHDITLIRALLRKSLTNEGETRSCHQGTRLSWFLLLRADMSTNCTSRFLRPQSRHVWCSSVVLWLHWCNIYNDIMECYVAWSIFDPGPDGQNGIREAGATGTARVTNLLFLHCFIHQALSDLYNIPSLGLTTGSKNEHTLDNGVSIQIRSLKCPYFSALKVNS